MNPTRINPWIATLCLGYSSVATRMASADVVTEWNIKAGEIVSTMGDRVGAEGKSATATFFGSPARFPTGPFLLAHLLACPVYLSFGLYFEPNRYELFCEPFAEKIALPREGRDQALAALAQRYATRLEEYCRRAEYNWFNFFEFWEEPKKEERS